VGLQGLVAAFGVEEHGCILGAGAGLRWPFSDLESDPAGRMKQRAEKARVIMAANAGRRRCLPFRAVVSRRENPRTDSGNPSKEETWNSLT
jgi:hypothetical protein